MIFKKSGFLSVALLLFGICANTAFGVYNFYVDPVNGNDSWDGTAATYQSGTIGPKLTLNGTGAGVGGVQLAVRNQISAGITADIVVQLESGTYFLTKTLALTTADCSPTYSVTWQAYQGEAVNISGGQQITTTWYYNSSANLWYTTIPSVANGTWWFRDLFMNDVRQPRSRWPQSSYDVMTWSGWTPSDPNLQTVNTANAALTTMTLNTTVPTLTASDMTDFVDIKTWATNRALITSSSGTTINTATAVGVSSQSLLACAVNDKVYLENNYTFITLPGQWALASWGALYWLSGSTNPNGNTWIAPNLTNVLTLEGTSSSSRVTNVSFIGLNIEHANMPLPAQGYQAWQSGLYNNTSGVAIVPPAAVYFTYTEDCSLNSCSVVRCGGAGAQLGVGSYQDVIDHCMFTDNGSIAIIIGDTTGYNEGIGSNPLVTAYGSATNNTIYLNGRTYTDAAGIWDAYMKYANISNNTIYDQPYDGIQAGWNFSSTTTTSQQNVTIGFNYIYDVMRYQADGGGIYTCGLQQNTSIYDNLIESTGYSGQWNAGLYADEGSADMYFAYNVVVNSLYGNNYYQNTGTLSVTVLNNIFQYGGAELARVANGGAYGTSFQKNIVWQYASDPFSSFVAGAWNQWGEYGISQTCYYYPAGGTETYAGWTWAQWQTHNDANSYSNQDPMFEDNTHANQNWQLQSTSPLLGAPMDFIQVGISGSTVGVQ